QSAILPDFIKSIASYERSYQKTLFAIILKLLPQWKAPDRGSAEEDNLREKFGFDTSPADAVFLSEHFTSVILLNLAVFTAAEPPVPLCCPGVPPAEFEFLTSNSKDTIPPMTLVQIKQSVIRFALSVLNDVERFWPCLAGSMDNITEVVSASEDALKKVTVDYESEEIVKGLYVLFLGDENTPPVPAKFRTRIFQLFCKSRLAANTAPEMINAIEEGVQSESVRENTAAIEFVHWVGKMGKTEVLDPIAPEFVKVLHSWIMHCGWPKSHASSNPQERSLRGFAYEAIGSLIRRSPSLAGSDTAVVDFLFESLRSDIPDMRPSIQEALSSLIPVLPQFCADFIDDLRLILENQFLLPTTNSNCQYLALRYCVAAYAFSDPQARFICLLGLDPSNQADVIAEARKGLHPYWYRKLHRPDFKTNNPEDFTGREYEFPDFIAMLEYMIQSWWTDEPAHASGSATIENLAPELFVEAIKFMREILFMKALESKPQLSIIDEGWQHKLEEAVEFDEGARSCVVELLRDWSDLPEMRRYMGILYDGFASGKPGLVDIGKMWIEVLSLSPPQMVAMWDGKLESLEALMWSSKAETRLIAAHAAGVLVTTDALGDEATVKELVRKYIGYAETTETSRFPRTHGAIAAVAYMLARLNFTGRLELIDAAEVHKFVKIVVAALDQPVEALRDVAMVAMSQLGMYKVLSVCSAEDVAKGAEILLTAVKNKKDERAMAAFGNVMVSSCDAAVKLQAVEAILALYDTKQVEFLFSSGEALACIAGGWGATVLRRSIDIQGSRVEATFENEPNVLGDVLDNLLGLCKTTKPALKKATCIWLLSAMQFCGHMSAATERLQQLHFAFLGLLGDRDDVIQESASRGLGLVYDCGNAALREDLVRSLVSSFTSDTRTNAAGRVSAETQLFDSGVLNTGEGSVSTYKDIMSLASEAGDPSLIYKFMSLASSSAIWSTRKGAAFGLGSILAKASLEDIILSNPRLAKNLVPKLYRYRYDPNVAVQQSMKDIWDALVSDSGSIVEAQFDGILEELLTRIGDREWRVRQASCAALEDLLSSSKPSKYENELERIWQMSFRALDDIKESVRTQAVALCRSLARGLVRRLDSGRGGAAMLERVLPFLLGNSGLQSQAEEVRAFALETILQLVKKGGVVVRPFAGTVIEELLQLLSTQEPQAVNYIALNADKYGLTGSAIDATRLASVRGSPMMEAIEHCIEIVSGADAVKEIASKVQAVIRKSVGLPSKVGSSRVVVLLVVRHGSVLGRSGDRLLKTVLTQLTDRNETVARSFATAAGYLCRVVGAGSVRDVVAWAEKEYIENGEEDRARLVSGAVVRAVSKQGGEKVMRSATAGAVLGLAYVGRQDGTKVVREQFESVWTENGGGSGAVRQHLLEILRVAARCNESTRWQVRQTAALAVAEAARQAGKAVVSTEGDAAKAAALFEALIAACAGRSWEGKVRVVEALGDLAVVGKGWVEGQPGLAARVEKVLRTEAARREEGYAAKAACVLAAFGAAYEQR
ncbi:proteasome stabiliser-domain-containing protein, partial [Limtongia smithiae]|uniref:proteasome stabiliser-domain-containing protein n=1 Tax=Limtongia smithiae TaxID=1125753 RepID=UPI0034CFA7F3